jgi:hypothetical protein
VSRSGSGDAHEYRREQIDRQGSGGQAAAASSASSSSSKLKVTIKDKGAAPAKSQPASQQEIDLFNAPTVGHSSSSDQFGDFASKCG